MGSRGLAVMKIMSGTENVNPPQESQISSTRIIVALWASLAVGVSVAAASGPFWGHVADAAIFAVVLFYRKKR